MYIISYINYFLYTLFCILHLNSDIYNTFNVRFFYLWYINQKSLRKMLFHAYAEEVEGFAVTNDNNVAVAEDLPASNL